MQWLLLAPFLGLRERLVLAIGLLPLDDLVTLATQPLVGKRQDHLGLLAVLVVMERHLVLVRGTSRLGTH